MGCFFDDLIITGRDADEHLRNLDAVLQRLQQFGFKLQERKCTFMAPSLTFLGFTVNSHGICRDHESIEAVRRAPRPSRLQSFLGLVN